MPVDPSPAPAAPAGPDEIGRLLAVLSHPVRLEIVRMTVRQEATVGAVAERLQLAQPATSQHLKVLRDAGLVQVRRDGNKRLYRADLERAEQVRAFLDELWPAGLAELKTVAERIQRDNGAGDG